MKKNVWPIAYTIVCFAMFLVTVPASAQSRSFSNLGGDLGGLLDSLRLLIGWAAIVVPAVILSMYTYKMKPKDVYDAAWLAIGWCALAYIVR